MKLTIQFAIVILLSFASTSVCAQTEWELEKSDEGINVYTRVIPDIDFKEFKADVTIQAPISDLIHALNDIPEHTNWMMDIDKAEVIQITPEILTYHISVPFPFKDRFAVITTTVIESQGSYRIEMQHAEDPISPPKNMVPLSYINGYWEFTIVEENVTHVVYQFISDPSGSIPDWLVNSFVVQSPYKTLGNLRERLEK